MILYQQSIPVKNKEQTYEYILNEVSIHSNISIEDVLGRSRNRKIMYARHLLAYTMYRTGLYSLKDIGLKIGGRDHATIINSRSVVEDLLSVKDDIMYPLYLKIKHLINENNNTKRTM